MPILRSPSPPSTGPRAGEEARADFGLDPTAPTLLVTGGSQGARRLNDAACAWRCADLLAAGVQVLHAAGPDERRRCR